MVSRAFRLTLQQIPHGLFRVRGDAVMTQTARSYIAIDMKSFFASVECVERGLPPLSTHLVVADESRTEKTICLAVTPSLKALGVPGRPRLFEVVERVRAVNAARRAAAGRQEGRSVSAGELARCPEKAVDYVVAAPRMALYKEYSQRVYNVFLRHVAPEDVHRYSIDEVFIDVTPYLATYRVTAHELAVRMIRDVLSATGVTATAGIGTNLYLCKVAMDIVAKHMPPDGDGVRIAELDEASYRRKLWAHTPLTDFWRVGRATMRRLAAYGMYTMGDIARQSVRNDEALYELFGVNAELLIDHAWGWEPCTIAHIKAYRPRTRSVSSGQVLQKPYTKEMARVVVKEMAEAVALDIFSKKMVTDTLSVYVGYDRESAAAAGGRTARDWYGRVVPRPAHGSVRLATHTASVREIVLAADALFCRITQPGLTIRRLNIAAGNLRPAASSAARTVVQLDLFRDNEADLREMRAREAAGEKERRLQDAILNIKNTYGKNALLRGLDFAEEATAIARNNQIGGHKA